MRGWISAFAAAALAACLAPAQAAGPLSDGPLPHGGRPAHYTAFPAIHDWRTLTITLRRGVCFGACPVYSVTIGGDGTVAWHGERFVGVPGEASARIPMASVKALTRAFRRAQFFWLYDDYRGRVTDMPTYTVSIAYDGHEKTVSDYAGGMVGMPQAVSDIEALIDKTAGTARWIKRDAAQP